MTPAIVEARFSTSSERTADRRVTIRVDGDTVLHGVTHGRKVGKTAMPSLRTVPRG